MDLSIETHSTSNTPTDSLSSGSLSKFLYIEKKNRRQECKLQSIIVIEIQWMQYLFEEITFFLKPSINKGVKSLKKEEDLNP